MRLVFVFVAVWITSVAHADRVMVTPAPRQGPSLPPRPHVRVYQPPAELAKLARDLDGAWSCKGVLLAGDGSSTPIVGSLATKLELGGAWLQTTFVQNGSPRFVAFVTYDAIAKQWTRSYFDSAAGRVEQTSLGDKNGVWTWTGTSSTVTGTFDSRDFEQRDGAKLKMWGDLLLGGQWQKAYEVTCTK